MKKLLIVCEEKYKVYGDYLAQLISMDDDEGETVIGVKDGTLTAQVWTEKDYAANSSQLASSQYIIFIGRGKLIKEKSTYMKVVYSQYGTKYGWLGKQAFLLVDKIVSVNEYEDFINYATTYQTNLEKLIQMKEKQNKLLNVVRNGVGIAALAAVGGAIAITPIAGISAAKWLSMNKKIEQQQFSFAVMKFYLDSLNKFLEQQLEED